MFTSFVCLECSWTFSNLASPSTLSAKCVSCASLLIAVFQKQRVWLTLARYPTLTCSISCVKSAIHFRTTTLGCYIELIYYPSMHSLVPYTDCSLISYDHRVGRRLISCSGAQLLGADYSARTVLRWTRSQSPWEAPSGLFTES